VAAFQTNVLRRMSDRIKVNENWRKPNNEELIELFGNLNIFSFVKVRRPNWIGHVYRMGSNKKVSHVFNNNPDGRRLRGRPNKRLRN
jgi:hypothetical protein